MDKSVSYRRNRDYIKSFAWTYEYPYKCYVKAKEDPKIGYMNRLNEYWDKIHPEVNCFSSKNLRDHISSIIKRNVIKETSFNIESRTNETNTEMNNYNDNTTNADNNCSAASNKNNRDNDISNRDNRENIKRDVYQIPDEVTHLKDLLRDTFIKNYKETLEKELYDRLINTRLNKKIDKNIIIAANDIAKEILETTENPGFWELNCLIYATAMMCKGYNNDIQTMEPEKAKEKLDIPKWIYQLEESISRVRREINQITVFIKCKTEKQFTAHQKRLLNKFLENYGNTRMATLKFKCITLKQDLKSKTEKLRYQKKIIERKKINKLFYKDPKKVYRAMKGSTITPKNIPSKQNVEMFWKGIWNNPSECNVIGVDWMKEFKSNYCLNATQKLEIEKL